MLVITRFEGEEVVIGDPAKPLGVLRIASIKGDRVRLAFEFPKDIGVYRRELADQILAEGPAVAGKIGHNGLNAPAAPVKPTTAPTAEPGPTSGGTILPGA